MTDPSRDLIFSHHRTKLLFFSILEVEKNCGQFELGSNWKFAMTSRSARKIVPPPIESNYKHSACSNDHNPGLQILESALLLLVLRPFRKRTCLETQRVVVKVVDC